MSKGDTVILDGAGDKKAIEERCEQVHITFFSHVIQDLLILYSFSFFSSLDD